jgi:hypothetical protein
VTHDELLAKLDYHLCVYTPALRAVVELHKPSAIPDWVPTEEEFICWCAHMYPCPTIQAIEKGLL